MAISGPWWPSHWNPSKRILYCKAARKPHPPTLLSCSNLFMTSLASALCNPSKLFSWLDWLLFRTCTARLFKHQGRNGFIKPFPHIERGTPGISRSTLSPEVHYKWKRGQAGDIFDGRPPESGDSVQIQASSDIVLFSPSNELLESERNAFALCHCLLCSISLKL